MTAIKQDPLLQASSRLALSLKFPGVGRFYDESQREGVVDPERSSCEYSTVKGTL